MDRRKLEALVGRLEAARTYDEQRVILHRAGLDSVEIEEVWSAYDRAAERRSCAAGDR